MQAPKLNDISVRKSLRLSDIWQGTRYSAVDHRSSVGRSAFMGEVCSKR